MFKENIWIYWRGSERKIKILGFQDLHKLYIPFNAVLLIKCRIRSAGHVAHTRKMGNYLV
jgi:hypothetical protein